MTTNAAAIPMYRHRRLGRRNVYSTSPNMGSWLKTLMHKPLKALVQALPVATAFIPGVGTAVSGALGASAAAAIASIGTSMAVMEAMQKMGTSAVAPLVAATLQANGTEPTAANVDAATNALIAQLQSQGFDVSKTGTSLLTSTILNKYGIYLAVGGVVFLVLMLRK